MTKDFLPRTTASLPLRTDIPDAIRIPTRFRPCIGKLLPILGIFSLFFSSALIGFSIVTVNEGYVGYYPLSSLCNYSCIINFYPPGMYLELPFKKSEFKIVNVSPRDLILGHIPVSNNETILCKVKYEIKNLNSYLHTLILFKTEQNLDVILIDEMKKFIKKSKVLHSISVSPSVNISYEIYGLLFTELRVIV